MNYFKRNPVLLLATLTAGIALSGNLAAELSSETNGDFAADPLLANVSQPPNVLVNMSVETPMGGAAYPDHLEPRNYEPNPGTICPGRPTGNVGMCYDPDREYLGYFDADKCYNYTGNSTTGYFVPSSVANNDHSCGGNWSGNFMNWASMTAIDMFVWTMTGGHRVIDTDSVTVVRRARQHTNNSWYPDKAVSSSGVSGFTNVAPSTVTPFGDNTIWMTRNDAFTMRAGTSRDGTQRGIYRIAVQVCDQGVTLEDNCRLYSNGLSNYYKPVGLIQKNAEKMRFGVMAYSNDNSRGRDGGVLRAPMKYVGPTLPDGSINTEAEYGTDGILLTNPLAHAVGKSGVINYMNQFSDPGFKSFDPIGELYYECLNYLRNRGPTSTFYGGLGTSSGGFPIYTNWSDPIIHHCQKNFIVGINDANPWRDKKLPGTHFNSATFSGRTLNDGDYGVPANADPEINVTALTNRVGDMEELTGAPFWVGCVDGDCNMSCPSSGGVPTRTKILTGLGEVMGTCPFAGKENSYYIAGLAYYGRVTDIRDDLEGDQEIETFMIDTQEFSNTPLLERENMLWLAGKYGGFTDLDDNDMPNDPDEWDEDGDGNPDNYVLAADPENLVDGLTRIFDAIAAGTASGTAAAVVTNSSRGTGAVYQALYEPVLLDNSGNEVRWTGTVHGLWVDEFGLIREDNGDAILGTYTADPVIEFFFDDVDQRTKFNRFTSSDANDFTPSGSSVQELTDLNTIWDAGEGLRDLTSVNHRAYGSTASNGRHIFTWVDEDLDRIVDGGETKLFEWSTGNFDSNNMGFLNLDDEDPPPGDGLEDDAQDLISYIRGNQVTDFRNRQLIESNGTTVTYRLGDIVHSTPTVVGTPAEAFDLLYGDQSYATFRLANRNRRQVVYVGANDGMLHAFNAGFYRAGTKQFSTTPAGGGVTAHPLGAELWSYIPGNLLGHLRWLKDNDYAHMYYVDGKPRAFDVKAFNGGSDWGTILVVPFRLGGGDITVDTASDGLGAPNDSDDYTMKSAYIVLDITDPESAPTVLAEIIVDGYATSVPAAIAIHDPSDGNPNKWFLVFGNGPDVLTNAVAAPTTPFQLQIHDLTAMISGSSSLARSIVVNSGVGLGAFAGDFVAADWDLDFLGDAFYFGISRYVLGDSEPHGLLAKLDTGESPDPSSWALQGFYGVEDRPYLVRPALGIDSGGNPWVFSGTGRLLANADKETSGQEVLVGLKDGNEGADANFPPTDIVNVTSAAVTGDGTVSGVSGATDFDALVDLVAQADGWKILLPTFGTDPSTRIISDPSLLGGVLLQPTYTPDDNVCIGEGTSELYGLFFETGTASSDLPIFQSGTIDDTTVLDSVVALGPGQASSPSLHVSPLLGTTKTCTQTSTGSIECTDVGTLTPVVSGEVSWRELRGD